MVHVFQAHGPDQLNVDSFEIILDEANPYHFFNPGSTVSGRVNYCGNATGYRLDLTFEGLNKANIVRRGSRGFDDLSLFTNNAFLFSYRQKLHDGPSRHVPGIANSMYGHYFRHRFPTNSEGRRTVQSKESEERWSSTVHPLPPSFENTLTDSATSSHDDFADDCLDDRETLTGCSIEYILTATLSVSGYECISVSLPILFVPFASRSKSAVLQSASSLQPRANSLPLLSWNTDHQVTSPVKEETCQLVKVRSHATASVLPIILSINPDLLVGKKLQITLKRFYGDDNAQGIEFQARQCAYIQSISIRTNTCWRVTSESHPSHTELQTVPI